MRTYLIIDMDMSLVFLFYIRLCEICENVIVLFFFIVFVGFKTFVLAPEEGNDQEIEIRFNHDTSRVVSLPFINERWFQWQILNIRLNLSWNGIPIRYIVGSFKSFWYIWLISVKQVLVKLQVTEFVGNSLFLLNQCFSACSSPLNPDIPLKMISPYRTFSGLSKYVLILRIGFTETTQIWVF